MYHLIIAVKSILCTVTQSIKTLRPQNVNNVVFHKQFLTNLPPWIIGVIKLMTLNLSTNSYNGDD